MNLPWSSRRLTFVAQLTASECPVACLQMVLAHHGCPASRQQIRSALSTGRDGASALAILEAARRFGLEGRGLQVDVRGLHRLRPGTILHWDGRHFVVLERTRGQRVWILDPAVGRRRLSLPEVERAFSGLALEFMPAPGATARPPLDQPAPSSAGRIAREALLQPRVLVSLAGSSLALTALGVAGALVVAALVEHAGGGPSTGSMMVEPTQAIVALAAGTALARTVHRRGLSAAGQAIEHELGRRLGRGLLILPSSFGRMRTAEDLARRLAGVDTLRRLLLRCVSTFAVEGTMVLAYLLVLWSWARPVAWAVVGLAAVQGGATAVLRRTRGHADVARRAARATLESFESQVLRGLDAIKAVGAEAAVAGQWSARQDEVARRTSEHERVRAAFGSVLEGLAMALPLALVAVGAHEVSRGALTLPSMIGACFLSVFFLRALVSVFGVVELLPSIRATLTRLDDVLEQLPPPRDQSPERPRLPAPIELREVTAGCDADGSPVLVRLSATLGPARHIAIVGRSGAGKSLIAALLTGMVPPHTGRVLIGGHAIEGPVPPWVALVPQAPTLFDGTLRHNITLGAIEADDARVIEAARIADLHESVAALPLGYQTPVIDGGTGLPEGLRRRLTVARALLRNPLLLVLDESAAALGPEAEGALIRRALAGPTQTVITVTHHRQTTERADVVVVVEQGRIASIGHATELRDRCPLFRELTR